MIVATESSGSAPDEEREVPGHDRHHPDHGPGGDEHDAGSTASLSWTQRRVHGAILWYQRLREGRPSPCRFYPTCSSYALEAFETHGTWRGGWLTLRRLGRCRPLGPSGYDPVPIPSDSSQHPPTAARSTPSRRKGG